MKFGVREICNVTFKAKTAQKIGTMEFKKGQPVLYIDTAKTSTTEGAATTVYATGGRGDAQLIAWEGEKTLSFTVEDALLSPIGFAVLSGAGIIPKPGVDASKQIHVHMTTNQLVALDGTIDLADAVGDNKTICAEAPIFVMATEADGSITGNVVTDLEVDGKKLKDQAGKTGLADLKGKVVTVDYYVLQSGNDVTELQIDASHFAGYYYVEADTLFRKQADGKDMPAILTLPNVKIQSNFTFEMAASGDPSTFTFTMDAFPGYTMFDQRKKVLMTIQILDESVSGDDYDTVFGHTVGEDIWGDEPEKDPDSTKPPYPSI